MGANIKWDDLRAFIRHQANMLVDCASCDHFGILDTVKLNRYFFCHGWQTTIASVRRHLYCSCCRGKPNRIRPTPNPPDRPEWMMYEYQWRELVRRLRNW